MDSSTCRDRPTPFLRVFFSRFYVYQRLKSSKLQLGSRLDMIALTRRKYSSGSTNDHPNYGSTERECQSNIECSSLNSMNARGSFPWAPFFTSSHPNFCVLSPAIVPKKQLCNTLHDADGLIAISGSTPGLSPQKRVSLEIGRTRSKMQNESVHFCPTCPVFVDCPNTTKTEIG